MAANLLGNALVHTPAGTPVDVVCDAQDGFAVLRVADQGPGLTAEQAAHVFDPFYRADPSRTRASGGDGLGLAIVAAVVHAHGGTVSVESEPGKGATFIVKLPLPAQRTRPARRPPPTQRRSASRGDRGPARAERLPRPQATEAPPDAALPRPRRPRPRPSPSPPRRPTGAATVAGRGTESHLGAEHRGA